MEMRHILVVDDEEIAREVMMNYVAKVPYLKLMGTCENAIDAHEYVTRKEVDLLFLDIEMPDLNGIEFARLLENKPKIVFTTAYEKYALQGFKLDAIDYLLKPFGYSEFLKAVEKVRKQIGYEKAANKEEITKGKNIWQYKSN